MRVLITFISKVLCLHLGIVILNYGLKKYEFDEQVMVALFDYCFGKSALHKNYVQTVAEAWSKNNIKTYNDLENYYQKHDNMNKIKKAICKKLGRYTALTEFEEEYIEKWILEYGYDLNVINIALKKTTSKSILILIIWINYYQIGTKES